MLRFFQDGLTGSAWGDWANYTDSPLRAFESELGVTCFKRQSFLTSRWTDEDLKKTVYSIIYDIYAVINKYEHVQNAIIHMI